MLQGITPPTLQATRVRSDPAASSARDVKSLGVNASQCQACQGRGFALLCMVDACNRFMAPRFVSTLVTVVAAFTALAVLV